MAKNNKLEDLLDRSVIVDPTFVKPLCRDLVFVPCRKIDQTVEVVQGKSDTVAKLYQDYVMGKLDPSQIAGSPVYDPEGSDEVDDFNHFGITLEEATEIGDRGVSASRAVREQVAKNKKQKEVPLPANIPNPPADSSADQT